MKNTENVFRNGKNKKNKKNRKGIKGKNSNNATRNTKKHVNPHASICTLCLF